MKKRTLQHALIITVLVMLTGCASMQMQARVSSCQRMITNIFSASNRIPRQERQALMRLDELAPSGLAPVASGAFPCKSRIPPCLWRGVTCASGHVTEITLHGEGLSGEIPLELVNLLHLAELKLSANLPICFPSAAEFELWMVGISDNDFDEVPYCE